MHGTIIENSLSDKTILNDIHIIKTWTDDGWILHDVVVEESQFEKIQNALAKGPWYVHFWNNETITVVYKEKMFFLKKDDTSTWVDAITYGKSIGIPVEQLDFAIH